MVVQRYGRPHGRGSGALAVTAVLVGSLVGAGVVAGCAAPEAPRRPVDPALAVRGAAEVLTRAGSAKASTSMEMASGGTRVTIRGEGGYDFRRRSGRLRVVLPKDPAGTDAHRPITELLTPGALYMKNRGAGVPADKWVRVDTTTLDDGNLVTGGATDPAAAAELLRGVREVAYLGEVDLAGVKVSHYRGVADIARAAGSASPYLRGALTAAAKGFTEDAVPFDAYLDGEGRLRKVRHQFSFSNQGRTVAVASTTLLYGFGVPVEVRLPDHRDIYAGKIES
ncbi:MULTISPECIES: hypothetical protein [unclassified Streptomyces]|uniref:hypothetical protein n=1 Tax=unclassified Streptomyces TaxID=2593676 RepID=UPI00166073E0|nr:MULTISPECIES: hypothetical protein [unclassified Streptomyces]MBD0712478.1 hypothetical protein [Streptomyces sp. CBMA291]MBD0716852.1 hypothetical protein [Streptomyces sp. CBMA370]